MFLIKLSNYAVIDSTRKEEYELSNQKGAAILFLLTYIDRDTEDCIHFNMKLVFKN